MNTNNQTGTNQRSFTIMGATGKIGRRVTQKLLEAGHRVKALGRSPEKLRELELAGAETWAGEAEDAEFLTAAFRGVDAVFTLLPYDLSETDYFAQQSRIGEAIIRAVRAAGVRSLVFISSVGAELESGTGLILSLHEQEERLRRLAGVNVLIFRPGPYFENFVGQLELIRQAGICGDSFAPDLELPMITTRDVADAVAQALQARDWQGLVVRELRGQRDLSYGEAARIIGERIGRPDLAYVQFPYEEAAAGLIQAGFSPELAALEVEIARAANAGRLAYLEERNERNTTATSFEEFADELAAMYRAMNVAAAA